MRTDERIGRDSAEFDSRARLLAAARAYLRALPAPELAAALAGWPAGGSPAARAPCSLPVLRHLPGSVAASPGATRALAVAIAAAAPHLHWRQSYARGEVDAAFLDNYGWCELVGAGGLLPSATLAAGILVLGPSTHYPSHAHAAAELYVPVSGTAEWQQGDGGWQHRHPGTLIRHAGGERHAMRTGEQALVALYLWHGTGLAEPARLTTAAAGA